MVDPLSPATRAAKRNVLFVSFASILVKTFNLTVDKFPIAGATIGLERGALAFVVLAALLYFTASFILYYWIDIRNVEISSHQANAEEIFKKRIDRIAWRKAEKIESKIKKLVPEGCRMIVDRQAIFSALKRAEFYGDGISDNFFDNKLYGPLRLLKISQKTNPDLKIAEHRELYDPAIKIVIAAIDSYRWLSVVHRVIVLIPLNMTRLLYVIRNYGVDGVFPIALSVAAILNMYGFVNLEWVIKFLPSNAGAT